jgi:nucleoside-diphosphate-sugar epimerase
MTQLLVTGGTGVLGRRILRRLSGDVRVLTRGETEIEGVTVVRGDLETGEAPASNASMT